MLIGRKEKGIATLAMVICAAAVSGLVAFGSSKIMGMQYTAIGSSTNKMIAQNDVLNRAEIIKASPYDNVVSQNNVLDNGFYEDVDVSEDIEDGLQVKTAKVNVYKDKTKKELISSMIVKRTNPTAALADNYKPEGTENTAYNVSTINKYFAKTDKDVNEGSVGSPIHPVFVKDGKIVETDFSNVLPSTSRNILAVNDDGSLGTFRALDFFSGSGVSTVSVGVQDLNGDYFTRRKGADIDTVPYYGQMIIVGNDHNQGHAGLGRLNEHAHHRLGVNNSGLKGYKYWVRSDYGAGRYNLGEEINRFGLASFHPYNYPDNPKAPFIAIFGDSFDTDGSYNPNTWLLVGTSLEDRAPSQLFWYPDLIESAINANKLWRWW